MTADHCITVTASGESTVVCPGHGDPGDSGVTAGDWTLRDLPEARPSGTVFPVQCDPDGTCASPLAGRWCTEPIGRTAFGALLLAMGLTFLSLELPPAWLPRFSRTRFRHWMWASCGGLAVLLVGAEAAYLFA
ncbi:hypothetical protein ACFC6L_19785 [Kitasatospora phosalacinea]|uniref:hypothetical protein n=1 Tax=Kitasatospora phosalacinea TaxID=2065 RepID=UPI0035E3833C